MACEFASTATTAMAGTDRSHISHQSGAVKEKPGRVTYKAGTQGGGKGGGAGGSGGGSGAGCGMLSPQGLPSSPTASSIAEYDDEETYDV